MFHLILSPINHFFIFSNLDLIHEQKYTKGIFVGSSGHMLDYFNYRVHRRAPTPGG